MVEYENENNLESKQIKNEWIPYLMYLLRWNMKSVSQVKESN